ncbi:MAG: ornithine--oxo-acid transaminase [Rhodocyclaceae bacterium]|nr:ornithine--oxo-acid transaminase [Rhodocyclaceae bacterium]
MLNADADRPIRLIGVASGLGAPAAASAACAQAPEALRRADIDAAARRNGHDCQWEAMVAPGEGSAQAVLATLLKTLGERVAACIAHGQFPVVIGGDHAIAAGTWRGAAQALQERAPGRQFGLLWLDAHADVHTRATSPTGNLHDMPLAALLGINVPGLGSPADLHLKPHNLIIVGLRSFEAVEMSLLRRLGVKIYDMEEIGRRGLRAVMDEAVQRLSAGTEAFGISIDLDVVGAEDAPGVSTPCSSGLGGAALCEALHGICQQPKLSALEIAEFNPAHDIEGRTARLVHALLEAASSRSAGQLRAWENRYGAHNYTTLPPVLTRGAGVHVWDVEGRRYLDMMSAYSAVSFGHAHPRLVEELTRQAQRLAVTSRAYHNDRLPVLLRRLRELFGFDAALPVNTGLEAVETALKAARKWAYKVKGVAPEAAEIIACEGNFHGRSIAIVGLSSEAQYRDGFGPFPPGGKRVPYGDAAALEAAITPQTAAFLVEPIQGEGGIVVPPAGYLAACAAICRRHNVLLICDEIQTGLGRTGKRLACEHDGVRPDGVILGKALGGGLLPISAFLADRRVMDVFGPGDHGSTFGGNPLAATVALEALNILVEQDLPARAAELGDYLQAGLRQIASPLIRDIRGRGLFVGLEVDGRYTDARAVCMKLLGRGVLTMGTRRTVIRLAPPLIIERAEIDAAVAAVAGALADVEQELPRAA